MFGVTICLVFLFLFFCCFFVIFFVWQILLEMHQSVKLICTIINLFSINNFVYHACVEFIHFFSSIFFWKNVPIKLLKNVPIINRK